MYTLTTNLVQVHWRWLASSLALLMEKDRRDFRIEFLTCKFVYKQMTEISGNAFFKQDGFMRFEKLLQGGYQ